MYIVHVQQQIKR